MSKPKVKPTPLLFRCERPPAGGAGPSLRAYGSGFFGIFLESTVPVFMGHLFGLPFPGFFGLLQARRAVSAGSRGCAI
jgi:hypothetical protein